MMLRAFGGCIVLAALLLALVLPVVPGRPVRSMPQPLPPQVVEQQRIAAEAISAKYHLGTYGNWCGGGHGGYQDCCNGKPCAACNATTQNECKAGKDETWKDCGPTEECKKACPPIDAMDLVCAYHDSCCIRNRLPASIPSCYPEGNYCWCDCNLVAALSKIHCNTYACGTFRDLAIEAFQYTLACWAFPPGNWTGQPYCDGVFNRKQPVSQFCSNTSSTFDYTV